MAALIHSSMYGRTAGCGGLYICTQSPLLSRLRVPRMPVTVPVPEISALAIARAGTGQGRGWEEARVESRGKGGRRGKRMLNRRGGEAWIIRSLHATRIRPCLAAASRVPSCYGAGWRQRRKDEITRSSQGRHCETASPSQDALRPRKHRLCPLKYSVSLPILGPRPAYRPSSTSKHTHSSRLRHIFIVESSSSDRLLSTEQTQPAPHLTTTQQPPLPQTQPTAPHPPAPSARQRSCRRHPARGGRQAPQHARQPTTRCTRSTSQQSCPRANSPAGPGG